MEMYQDQFKKGGEEKWV